MRDQRIKELARRLDNYQNGTVRMGEALHELRATVAPLPDKLTAKEQRGASIDELTQSCGLTQAEAQLMTKLHGNTPS